MHLGIKARPCYWLRPFLTKQTGSNTDIFHPAQSFSASIQESRVVAVEIGECGFEDFDEVVVAASRSTPILVDFWADWCAPCHAIAPQLERVVAGLQGVVRLVKVEVDAGENMKLAGHYRLRGFPTIMLFQAGEERARFSGARAAHWIEHWVQQHLA